MSKIERITKKEYLTLLGGGWLKCGYTRTLTGALERVQMYSDEGHGSAGDPQSIRAIRSRDIITGPVNNYNIEGTVEDFARSQLYKKVIAGRVFLLHDYNFNVSIKEVI